MAGLQAGGGSALRHPPERRVRRLALWLTVAAVLPGCGFSTSHNRSGSGGDLGDVTASPSPRASGQATRGGENNPATYTDSRFNYRITGPGPMSRNADGAASFAGEDERLVVDVVTGSRAGDPTALAQSDLDSLRGSTPNFQVMVQPTAVSLGGQRVIKLTYSSSGQSFTGKTIKFFNVRYYIAKNESTLAVISYRDASTEFDAQEADGFASSFRWL